jgi:predicted acetyltransferase
VTKLEIRPLTADDDLDAQRDIGERAFGAMSPAERENWRRSTLLRVNGGRFLGAFADGRPVGSASYHDMRQWWAGRELPMAGIASVKMAPEARGQGLGRTLMTEQLRQIAERGYPLSALYPATMPIYRSLGWELAGGRYHAAIPTRSLRDLVPPDKAITLAGQGGDSQEDGNPGNPGQAVPGQAAPSLPGLRSATPGDAASVISVLGRAHQAARNCGPLTRDVASVEDWLTHSEDYRYLGDEVFLAYHWEDDNEGLFVSSAVASSPEGARELWSLLAAHSSTADMVRVRISPDDPIWLLLRERDAKLVSLSKWMLRVVDAKAAIEGRGFPPGVHVSAWLTIADDLLLGNDGMWRLTVADGRATFDRTIGDPTALTMGPRGLAALYAGTPVSTLRLAGLVTGGSPAGDAALSAAFAGQSFMLDDF